MHQAVQNGSNVLFEDDRTVLKTKDGTVFDINTVGKLYYLPTVQSSDHMLLRRKCNIETVSSDDRTL